MVESTSSDKILVSNPTSTRGMRTPLAVMGEYTLFSSDGSLVASKSQGLEDHILFTHNTDHITAISIPQELTGNPSGRYHIAVGTNAGKVLMVRFQNMKLEQVQEYNCLAGPVRSILFGNKSKMMIVLGEGSVCFNPDTSGNLGPIAGHSGPVLCGVYNQESKHLFSAGEGNELLMHKGPPFEGQGKQLQHVHTGFVNQMVESVDHTKIACASADKSISIYDCATGDLIKHYKGAHSMGIYDLFWKDDQSFVTSSADNSCKLWSLNEDTCKHEYVQGFEKKDPSRQILGLIPNQDQVIGVLLGGTVKMWNNDSVEPVKEYKRHKTAISAMLTHSDGTVWYASEMDVFCWQPEGEVDNIKEFIGQHTLRVDLMYSTEQSVYSTGLDQQLIRYCDGQVDKKIKMTNKAISMTGNDEQFFRPCLFILDHKKQVLQLDPESLETQSTFTVDFDAVHIASNGVEVWLGDKAGVIHCLKAGSGEEITQLKKHTKAVTVMSVSPDGTKVATGDSYRYIHIWDLESKSEVATIGEHKDTIHDLQWSKDSSRMLSCTGDLSFGVTKMDDHKIARTGDAHGAKGVKFVCESLDGKTVYTAGGDNFIKLWPQA